MLEDGDWGDVAANLGQQRLAGERVRHRRHDYQVWVEETDEWECRLCGARVPVQRIRRGRNARKRGNRRELELARSLGGVKVGHHGGPEDVRAGLFNVQSKVRKAFPTWMTTELAKLPRTDGRVPILVVTSPPGLDPLDRRRRMSIVVLALEDWRDLHGEETA